MKKYLCDVCKSEVCLSACPEYRGYSPERGKPIGQCDECGEYIYQGERNYGTVKIPICKNCKEL